MTYLSARDIAEMSSEGRQRRLKELQEEMLQLRAQQSLGGSSSNPGAYKQVRRTIARLRTAIHMENKE
tara:strand:- start:1266 stop:1469 length:204 start_codon:yes stop_codon:yes gene_type:complete